MTTCPICKTEFAKKNNRQEYCSKKCYRSRYIKTCENPECHKSVKRKCRRFCSNHCSNKEKWQNPIRRTEQSEMLSGLWQDPIFRANHSGENHYLWQGGISRFPYSLDWSPSLRETIRERDGYRCVCGRKQSELVGLHRKLSVHHIDYDKMNCKPSNLISLCHPCNGSANIDRPFWTEVFNLLMVVN